MKRVQGAVSTFAIETLVENTDPYTFTETLGAYISGLATLPGSGEYVRALNVENRHADLIKELYLQYIYLLDQGSQLLTSQIVRLEDEGIDAQALLDTLLDGDDSSVLSSLAIGEFPKPEDLLEGYPDEANQAVMERNAKLYGADELRPMAVEVTISDKNYLFCADTLRYGDRWYMYDLSGNIGVFMAAISYAGGFLPLD